MSDKLRIHTLSKELGVTSKAILEKCKREGIAGVTNHMSTLSAGLVETIREWFTTGESHTAVETAAPVDLEKAKSQRRRRKKPDSAAPSTEDDTDEQTSTDQETAAEAAQTGTPAPDTAEQAEPQVPMTDVAVAEPPISEEASPVEPAAQEPPAVDAGALAAELVQEAPQATAAPAPPPPKLAPAGPQNVPAPAQMKGPRVVRVEKPDPVARPAPRMPIRPTPPEPGEPPATGGRPRGRGRGTDKEEADRKRQRVNPRRSVGSVSEVGERLKEWNDRDLLERQERLQQASGRGIHTRRALEKKAGASPGRVAPRKTKAQVNEPIRMHELCAATGIGYMQLFPKLKSEHNLVITRNTVIPTEIAQTVMLDYGVELEVVRPKTELDKLRDEFVERERPSPQPRPPVVTMLGHVDHGKTSLLDAIRKTSVADGEAGGITQHIGAYRVEREGMSVTFLDTPGHEAFTAMRARGANMTDVVVLVVAADDGLMPQTIEAINHAKAAKVNIVVALNKIDLPGVDVNKIYGQLSEHELTPTEWGGDTDVVKTSATTGQGIDELIQHLATLTELLDLKADPTVPATGSVIESQMQTGIGVATRVLVREGTLRNGDYLVCGPASGRVRMMRDDKGRSVREALPGTPVEVAGLDEVPNAGDSFYQVESAQRAKEVAAVVQEMRRQDSMVKIRKPQTLEDLFQHREGGELPELAVIIKADVQGSVDALLKTLGDIPSDQVRLVFLHTGVGGITEGDVVLAEASGAVVVGFNVTAEAGAQRLADTSGVDIRSYRVIYELVDDIRRALEGLLPREQNEETRGKAEVRNTFRVSRVGMVAGCMVTDGVIQRSHNVRVIRNGVIIIPTEEDVKRRRHRSIASLRRFKDDAREVRAGMECGIRVENFDDVKEGDRLEAYEVIETARKL